MIPSSVSTPSPQKRWKDYLARSSSKIHADETDSADDPDLTAAVTPHHSTSQIMSFSPERDLILNRERAITVDSDSNNSNNSSSSGIQGPRLRTMKTGLSNADLSAVVEEKYDDMPTSPSSDTGMSLSVKQRGRLLEPPRTPPPRNKEVLPSEATKEKIPFSREMDLEITVSEAVGLPLTTTATRIHVRLFTPTKEDVREASPFALSDLYSDYRSPKFAFSTKFKGKSLLLYHFINLSHSSHFLFYRENPPSNDDFSLTIRYIRSTKLVS
jgi:hypothetical protein